MCCCLVNHSSRHSLAERSAATSFSSSSRSSRSGSGSLQPPPPQPAPRRWGNFSTLSDRPPATAPRASPHPARPARGRPPSPCRGASGSLFRPPSSLSFSSASSSPRLPSLPRLFPRGGCRCRRRRRRRCCCQAALRPAAPAPGLESTRPPGTRPPLPPPPLGDGRRPSAPRSSGLPRRLHRPAPPRADLQRPAG